MSTGDLTPGEEIGQQHYKRWWTMPIRDAYTGWMMRQIGHEAFEVGRLVGRKDAARAQGCVLCHPGTPEQIDVREATSAQLDALIYRNEDQPASNLAISDLTISGELDITTVVMALDQLEYNGSPAASAAARELLKRLGTRMGSDGVYRRDPPIDMGYMSLPPLSSQE